MGAVTYECMSCGTNVTAEELSYLPEIKCICGFRVFRKVRQPIIKQLKAIQLKIRCPDCKEAAFLSDDFSLVKCENCGFDKTYGEYVKYVAYKDARYSDILSDYK